MSRTHKFCHLEYLVIKKNLYRKILNLNNSEYIPSSGGRKKQQRYIFCSDIKSYSPDENSFFLGSKMYFQNLIRTFLSDAGFRLSRLIRMFLISRWNKLRKVFILLSLFIRPVCRIDRLNNRGTSQLLDSPSMTCPITVIRCAFLDIRFDFHSSGFTLFF